MKTERVITSKEDRKRIAEMFGLDKSVISKAMNFLCHSYAARKARCYAVNQLGCTVYVHPSHLIEPKK